MKIPHGIVVSAHGLASAAGARVLRKGGNAFDAAVATSLMLGVVEPAFSGIGGGGFSLVHTASGEDLALDYRETAPMRATASMFSDASDSNRVGPLAVATPGLLAGHVLLLEKFGTMKFRDLARPAIEAARAGFSTRTVSQDLILQQNEEVMSKIKRFSTTAGIYIGRTEFPLLAKTLEVISEKGPEEFYHGSIPKDVSLHLKGLGGLLSEEDFGRYSVKERKPVAGRYRGCDVISMPPPSAGGALLIQGLGVIEETGNPFAQGEASRVDFMAALLGSLLGQKAQFGDPDFTNVPLAKVTSREAIRRTAREIASRGTSPRGPSKEVGSTTHFSVLDRHGNAVAATETVECYYGSGVTVPSLGLLLNDEMHDFDTAPGRPNSVAPRKRPASSMSPTILLKDGDPFLVLGASGATRIISSVFQVITTIVERKMDLPEALAAPRLHPTPEGLMLEKGISEAGIKRLMGLGWVPRVGEKPALFFGGVQAAMADRGIVTGAADPRRRGEAVSE